MTSNDNHEPPDLTYIADMDGRVLGCAIDRWSAFARENGAEHLAGGAGLNVFASCSDPETASAYRLMHSLLQSRKLDQYSFNFRCDSPERARLFRMTISWHPVLPDGAVIYRSQLLSERDRPSIALLSLEARTRRAPVRAVKLCSFCQYAWDSVSACWTEAEDHPAANDNQARTTHGVCGKCHDLVVAPLIRILGLSGR